MSKRKGGRYTAPKVKAPRGPSPREQALAYLAEVEAMPSRGHQCRAPMIAHYAPAGAVWTCPTCDKAWRVTHNHLGRICGCGWERIERTVGTAVA